MDSLKKMFNFSLFGKFLNGRLRVKKSKLHEAAMNGCLEAVEKLIENGADANLLYKHKKEKTLFTSLELAVLGGHVKVVEYLSEVTSNVSLISLIALASKNDKLEIVEYLTTKLELKAEFEQKKKMEFDNEKDLRSEILRAYKQIFILSCETATQDLEIKRLKREGTILKYNNSEWKKVILETEKELDLLLNA